MKGMEVGHGFFQTLARCFYLFVLCGCAHFSGELSVCFPWASSFLSGLPFSTGCIARVSFFPDFFKNVCCIALAIVLIASFRGLPVF